LGRSKINNDQEIEMEEMSLSRKERERNFRRKEIMDAAVKFFAEKGYNSTTLEEIAGNAEFGKGTLYNYFQGKEEIYKAIVDDVIENIDRIVKTADTNSKSFTEFIERYTKDLFKYCLLNKYSFLLFVREIAHLDRDYQNLNREELVENYSGIRETFIKRIEHAVKAKEIKKFNPAQLVVLYDHMVFPYIHHLIVCPYKGMKTEEEINFILLVLFEGVKNK
jgi:TetR/AcrR family transcriptional regulator, repressor of fatR-cypB operon